MVTFYKQFCYRSILRHHGLTFQHDNPGSTQHVLLWIVFMLALHFLGQPDRLIFLSHTPHLVRYEKAIATIAEHWRFNPTVGDDLARNSAGHQSMPCWITTCFQARGGPTPYSLPRFVTTKFRNKSFSCLEILIVCFSMFVLKTHQFLSLTNKSFLVHLCLYFFFNFFFFFFL